MKQNIRRLPSHWKIIMFIAKHQHTITRNSETEVSPFDSCLILVFCLWLFTTSKKQFMMRVLIAEIR